MERTTLGATGMDVSRLCLGCMSFGLDSSEKYDWSLGEEASKEIIDRAIDLGIDFFDTANVYSFGDSERVLGRALEGYDRDRYTIATKVYGPMGEDNPHSQGLSRKTVEQELENSLDRLGVDAIDLYQTHRWDYETPIAQTLRAFDDAIARGQVRYIGASSMWAHQFADALHTSDRLGLNRFVTMQNHYNVVYREEEREMLPLCANEDIGVIPWSPLARGFLARPHEETDATERGSSDRLLDERMAAYRGGGGIEINERVEELAERKGVTMAQIALAWLCHQDHVDAPIVGTTSIHHLEDAVEALDITLDNDDLDYLDEPYQPVPVSGHD